VTGSKQIQRITIEVPKVFYVNSVDNPKQSLVSAFASKNTRKVNKTLPRGINTLNLYEVSMVERKFSRVSIDTLMSHEDVQGIFETRTPSWFRVLLELGCVCEVNDARRRKEKEHAANKARFSMKQRQTSEYKNIQDLPPLNLMDMKFIPASYQRYLHPTQVQFKRIFLYHSQAEVGNKDRSVTCLFFVDSDEASIFDESVELSNSIQFPATRAAVWVSMKNREGLPSMKRLLKKTLASNKSIAAAPIEFSMHYAKTIGGVWKKVGDALRGY
jgi:hypothetical protein